MTAPFIAPTLLEGFAYPVETIWQPAMDELGRLSAASTLTQILAAVKQEDGTPVNNSTTFVDDEELTVTAEANASYEFWFGLIYNSNASADFKVQLSLPYGAAVVGARFLCLSAAGAVTYNFTGANAAVTGIEGVGADRPYDCWGVLSTDTTGGAVTVQWAQNSAHSSNTSVKATSWLRLKRVL